MLAKAEAQARIARLQHELVKARVDGAFLVYPIDLYYFAGTRQNSLLYVPAAGEPVLLVRKSLARARSEAALADIRPFPSSKELPQLLGEGEHSIGLTFDVLPVQQHQYYLKLFPNCRFMDISAANREIRSVKSEWELERLRDSARKLSSVFRQVPEFLQEGMRELDLSAEFESRLRKLGSEGYIRMRAFNQELFMGLAVSGTSAATPGFFDGAVTGRGLSTASPHGASLDQIPANSPVLIDYAGVFNGYIVDMTRIFSIGKLSERMRYAFQVSLEIQDYLQENLKPGALCEQLFLDAAAMAEKAGLAEFFMGPPGENARFVGHGVGLELDEFPVLAQGFKMPLQAGQTLAIEPKFVIPGEGVIGIENTFVVTPQGGEKLGEIPDEIIYL